MPPSRVAKVEASCTAATPIASSSVPEPNSAKMHEEVQALRVALEMSRQREQCAFRMLQAMRLELDNAYRMMDSREHGTPDSYMVTSLIADRCDESMDSESRSTSPACFDTCSTTLDLLATELCSSAAETEQPSRSESPSEFDLFMS